MPKRQRYLGNPLFQHLHFDEDAEEQRQTKDVCLHHDNAEEGLGYRVEGESPPHRSDGGVLTEDRDVGSEEDEDLPAGISGRVGSRRPRTGDKAYEQNDPFQRLGGKNQSGGGESSSNSVSRRSLTSNAPPPRELKVKLTKNLSTRLNSVRRYVDFTICNSDFRQPVFKIVKDEQDVYRLRNGDYLLRARLTFNTQRNQDDPYVKDHLAEIKFRGRLFRYNEDKESFEELAKSSQFSRPAAGKWRGALGPFQNEPTHFHRRAAIGRFKQDCINRPGANKVKHFCAICGEHVVQYCDGVNRHHCPPSWVSTPFIGISKE